MNRESCALLHVLKIRLQSDKVGKADQEINTNMVKSSAHGLGSLSVKILLKLSYLSVEDH